MLSFTVKKEYCFVLNGKLDHFHEFLCTIPTCHGM